MGLFRRKKDKLDGLYKVDVFVKDRKGISRGKHVEVKRFAGKSIHKITTYTGQIIIVEIS